MICEFCSGGQVNKVNILVEDQLPPFVPFVYAHAWLHKWSGERKNCLWIDSPFLWKTYTKHILQITELYTIALDV